MRIRNYRIHRMEQWDLECFPMICVHREEYDSSIRLFCVWFLGCTDISLACVDQGLAHLYACRTQGPTLMREFRTWKPLPKNVRRQCQRLNMDGKKCRRAAAWRESYHGAEYYNEIFNDDCTGWVQVDLCGLHASKCP